MKNKQFLTIYKFIPIRHLSMTLLSLRGAKNPLSAILFLSGCSTQQINSFVGSRINSSTPPIARSITDSISNQYTYGTHRAPELNECSSANVPHTENNLCGRGEYEEVYEK